MTTATAVGRARRRPKSEQCNALRGRVMPPLGSFLYDRALSSSRPVQRLASATPGRNVVLVLDAPESRSGSDDNPTRAAAAWRWALNVLVTTADTGGVLTICRVSRCSFPCCPGVVVAATLDAPWLLPEMRAAMAVNPQAVRAVELGSGQLRRWLECTVPPPGLIVVSSPRWALHLSAIMLNRTLAMYAPVCVVHRDLRSPAPSGGRHITVLLDGSFPWSGELVSWCRDALLDTGDRVTLYAAPYSGSHSDERRAREMERAMMLLTNWSSLRGGGRCILMRTHARAACAWGAAATVAGGLEGPAAQQGAIDILVLMIPGGRSSTRWFMGHQACAVIGIDRNILLQMRQSPLRQW
jgi:hypothetical protein